MSSFLLGFASATLPCKSAMMIASPRPAIRAHSNQGASNTFLSSKGFREPFLHLLRFPQNNVRDIAPSQNMAIKDMDNRNCRDVGVAAPPTVMDMAGEWRDGVGIIDFLERRNFLVTGATGFVAKVLIEKILRVAPNVGKIFLLIKAKDQQAAMDRVKDEIIGCELFICLKQKYGEEYTSFMLSKLVPVKGDIQESNMGIGNDSFRQITQEVDVIVNSAANTTFDERMLDPLILSYGKGRLPGFLVDPDTVIDVIPADLVANVTIAAMAKHGTTASPSIDVYHAASSTVNPIMMCDVFNYSRDYFAASPLTDDQGDEIQITDMEYFSSIDSFSSYIQRDIAEKSGLSKEIGPNSNPKQRSRLEARCKRMAESIIHLAKLYEPYMFYRARFDSWNTRKLMEQMSTEEGNKFPIDLRSINWEDYFANAHIPGLKRHVIKKASSS
ncbi:hypothetical protein EUGRSUZ_L01018 [Eucalyptus grandis]|uniref:Fatty acyl-CoA reductase n=3 Tax=Eucalyptus grandis TaxID=71139 RepID=A0AAD9TB51_EUCGR|nr:hypothetical protein EUGRSUZ_L01018 [Eucalyptus grandis]